MEQRECAIDERGYDCHAAGNGYLASGGPSKQAGVGNQRDVGTASSSPSRAVDATYDTIPRKTVHGCGINSYQHFEQ